MKTTPEALKDLFVAMGNSAEAVADLNQNVDVLNAFAEAYQGSGDAGTIPEAIENITAVAENIGGGSGDFVSYTLEVTVLATSAQNPPVLIGPIVNQDNTVGNYVPLSATGTNNINVVSTTLEEGAAMLTFIYDGTLELTTTTEDAVAINENNVFVFGDNGKLSVDIK